MVMIILKYVIENILFSISVIFMNILKFPIFGRFNHDHLQLCHWKKFIFHFSILKSPNFKRFNYDHFHVCHWKHFILIISWDNHSLKFSASLDYRSYSSFKFLVGCKFPCPPFSIFKCVIENILYSVLPKFWPGHI